MLVCECVCEEARAWRTQSASPVLPQTAFLSQLAPCCPRCTGLWLYHLLGSRAFLAHRRVVRIFPRCCDYTKLLAQCLIALGFFFFLFWIKKVHPYPPYYPPHLNTTPTPTSLEVVRNFCCCIFFQRDRGAGSTQKLEWSLCREKVGHPPPLWHLSPSSAPAPQSTYTQEWGLFTCTPKRKKNKRR